VTNPRNTVFSIKRFMGRRVEEVTEESKRVPYKLATGPNDLVAVDIQGKAYTPPEISAMILQKMKQTAGILLSGTGHGDRVGAGPKTTGKSEGLGLCFKSLRILGR
jgi:molecular chaperone DnaK